MISEYINNIEKFIRSTGNIKMPNSREYCDPIKYKFDLQDYIAIKSKIDTLNEQLKDLKDIKERVKSEFNKYKTIDTYLKINFLEFVINELGGGIK